MDGTPTSTEDVIYFKVYLKGYNNLSETIKNEMNNNINVSYYVNLEICDSENRNFFKKIEINLFRLPEEYYNKVRQNIMEGKKGNIYDVYNSNNDNNNNSNNNKINGANKINKNNKIKNLFSNIKNPLETDIKLDENNNSDNNNNIEGKNNINKNNEEINSEEARQKQSKKKISSLFNSDFD